MKRFKIGFLAVIALAAMSFTISENAGLFKKVVTETTLCFRDVDVKDVLCNAITSYDDNFSICPGEDNGLASQHIWAITLSSTYSLTASGAKPTACGVSTSDFCCVTLEEDPSPCPNQITFDPDGSGTVFTTDEYRVKRTFCRQ